MFTFPFTAPNAYIEQAGSHCLLHGMPFFMAPEDGQARVGNVRGGVVEMDQVIISGGHLNNMWQQSYTKWLSGEHIQFSYRW
jgi:hypothetical protein